MVHKSRVVCSSNRKDKFRAHVASRTLWQPKDNDGD